MMTCCATARWKLPTKPSGSADKKWLFLISTSPLLFSSTLLVALANITRFTDLSTGTIPSFRTLLEYHMMIPHWAPTILDGYAYYGRPQKPRRLIFSATFYVHTSVAELRLTTQSVCYSPTACEMSLGKHIHSHYPNPAKWWTLDDESDGFARWRLKIKNIHSCQLIHRQCIPFACSFLVEVLTNLLPRSISVCYPPTGTLSAFFLLRNDDTTLSTTSICPSFGDDENCHVWSTHTSPCFMKPGYNSN